MAIVEVQFRDQSFFELVKAQVVRTPLPSDFRAGLGPLLIERFECHDVGLTDDTTLQQAAAHAKPTDPPPNVGQTAPGELLLRASISLQLTTYAYAKAAGSLAAPNIAAEAKASLFIRLGVSPTDGLTFRVLGALVNVAGLVENEWRSINMAPGTQALTSPGDQLTFARAGLVAQSGVVAIRLGTRADDNVLAADPATINRLGGNQWGQFIAGQCFAELVAKSLNDAADAAVAGSTDPKIEITQRGDGAWLLPDRLAIASTNLNAIDALPADFDLPIRLEAAAALIPRPTAGPVDVIWGFDVDVRVQWIATDVLSDIGLGVIQSEVNDSIAEKLSDPPSGFIEVERTEEHVRYRSANWKDAPKSAAFSCHVSDVHVDDSGLVVLGSVDVKPPPTATFSATLPEWTLSGDCHNKSVRQMLTPLHVQVVGMDPRHEVYLVAEPVIEPPGTWSYTRSTSLPGASPPTLDVSFTRRNVPPTGGQSVYVYTNLGVRWINIGVLPPRPEVSERELLARTIDLISECMAISDRWGEGVMNLDWLVDPPDVFVDFGIPPIYEWVVNIDQVEEVDSIDLVAVGPDGARRQLGTARVVEGHVVAQVVTATDETLEIRTGTPMAGPTPRVSRRVVVPYSSTPVGNDVVAFGFEEGSVGVLRLDGTTQQLDAITADTSERPATAEQIEALQRRNELGLGATVRTRHLGASTVAAYDRGEIVMGVAGAFVPAVQPRQE